MGKVILEGLEFFAYHGYYDEEQKIGNKYAVDVEITTNFDDASVNDDLKGTVNYEDIYKIVQKVMSIPTKLLEHIGKKIIDEIQSQLGEDLEVLVKVSKFNPPIGGVCKKASIIISSLE